MAMAKENVTNLGLYSSIDRRLTMPVRKTLALLQERYPAAMQAKPFQSGTPQGGTDEKWEQWYEDNAIAPENQPAMRKAYIMLTMAEKLVKEYEVGLDAISTHYMRDRKFPPNALNIAQAGISQLTLLTSYLDERKDKSSISLINRRITSCLQDIEKLGGPPLPGKDIARGGRIG
jgi:hypothetical protein